MELVKLHGYSDKFVDVIVENVNDFRDAVQEAVESIEDMGDFVRITLNEGTIEDGFDVDTVIENLNYFTMIGIEGFRALNALTTAAEDFGFGFNVVEVENPRETEDEKRGIYVYIINDNPLVGMFVGSFLMAMSLKGLSLDEGYATGITHDGQEVENMFVYFPERAAEVRETLDVSDAVREAIAAGLDVTCIVSTGEYMGNATSEADWNLRCDVVKAANGGTYPPFWPILMIFAEDEARARHNW